jgi:hypothetical protein
VPEHFVPKGQVSGSCWHPECALPSSHAPPGGTILYKMIAALAVAVLAVGCTSIEHGKGAPDLKAQLLTVAELPAGWSIDNSNSGGDNTSTPSCLQRLDSELHANAKADASVREGQRLPLAEPGHRLLRG